MAKRRTKRKTTRKVTKRTTARARPARRMAKPAMKMAKPCPGGYTGFLWVLLIVAVLWLLNAWGVIALELPWLPLMVVLFILGMMWKYKKMCM